MGFVIRKIVCKGRGKKRDEEKKILVEHKREKSLIVDDVPQHPTASLPPLDVEASPLLG